MHGGGADRMTKFKLLVQKNHAGGTMPEAWHEWREEEASGAAAAIRKAYMRGDTQDVLAVVAVPARSWKPTPVRTETVSRVVLGEAPEPPEAA
jgi:hypothetical protein